MIVLVDGGGVAIIIPRTLSVYSSFHWFARKIWIQIKNDKNRGTTNYSVVRRGAGKREMESEYSTRSKYIPNRDFPVVLCVNFYTRLGRFCYSIREACECKNSVSVYTVRTLPLYTRTHARTHYVYRNILCSCVHLGGYIIYFFVLGERTWVWRVMVLWVVGGGGGCCRIRGEKLQHYMLLSNKTKIHINKIKRFFRDLCFIYKVVVQRAPKSR